MFFPIRLDVYIFTAERNRQRHAGENAGPIDAPSLWHALRDRTGRLARCRMQLRTIGLLISLGW